MKFSRALSRWKDVYKRLSGRGIYPYELAFLLDSPIRRLILSPKKLVERLHLATNSIVLEIGSGPGYFSFEVAEKIPGGQLYMFDIQSEMLKKSMLKLAIRKLKNMFPVQGNAVNLPFRGGVFDIVFLVTVLGEVTDQKECMAEINKVLRIGGIVSITEMKGDPDVLTQNEIDKIVSKLGFEFEEKYNSFKGYTINYKKVSDSF